MARVTNESGAPYRTRELSFAIGESKDVSDDVADYLTEHAGFERVEPEQPTCAEGDCSRTVDEEGQKCWQHDDAPETDGSEE